MLLIFSLSIFNRPIDKFLHVKSNYGDDDDDDDDNEDDNNDDDNDSDDDDDDYKLMLKKNYSRAFFWPE